MADLFSYFRRTPAKAKRRPVTVVAEDAIDLESMGGEISNVYLDIASVGAPVEAPIVLSRSEMRSTASSALCPSSLRKSPRAVTDHQSAALLTQSTSMQTRGFADMFSIFAPNRL